jgi:hypothetical protein
MVLHLPRAAYHLEPEQMTTTERQQSLAAARTACERLSGYKFSIEEVFRFQQSTSPNLGFFCYTLDELVGKLIAGFELLDAKEQKQIAAGAKGAEYGRLGAKHGKKGGRPRKTNGGKK